MKMLDYGADDAGSKITGHTEVIVPGHIEADGDAVDGLNNRLLRATETNDVAAGGGIEERRLTEKMSSSTIKKLLNDATFLEKTFRNWKFESAIRSR
ncbi:hypothetical protein PHYSODRAFT_334529 [Phytophthora sojae]|uniref:RxLR effector protein n=1 Tax=Phytophthora sojae (strain P6497) TaxID=1094619 RepID=G4ZPT3_PHYSP|nr:hypothetical protein PHYSODRAFT_334529 [Phytophthora sojae]EGZ16338.1 hypothetical protein PHYSODRAFT_334529 [Phytophthora sojae]|eukprot:XP_009530087.1 hypothetical protein PHYSODRAFT_334529 [Phytophthora sojae]